MGCVLSAIECLLSVVFGKAPEPPAVYIRPRYPVRCASYEPALPRPVLHTSSSRSTNSGSSSVQYSNRQVQSSRPVATVSPSTNSYASSSRSTYSGGSSIQYNTSQAQNSSSRSTHGGSAQIGSRQVQASRSTVTKFHYAENERASVIDCGKCFSCSHASVCREVVCATCRIIVKKIGCQNKWCTKHQCRENSFNCSCTTERLLKKHVKGRKSVYGHFKCNECGKKWTSALAWIKQGQLLEQACKDCNFSVKPFKVVSFGLILT